MTEQRQAGNEVKAAICQRILNEEKAIVYIDIHGNVGDNNTGNVATTGGTATASTITGDNNSDNVTTSTVNERLISVIEAQQREISELMEIIMKLISNNKNPRI